MTSMEHSRSLKMMEKIDQIIDWSKIEAVLLKHYAVGTSIEGADAYPPLWGLQTDHSTLVRLNVKLDPVAL